MLRIDTYVVRTILILLLVSAKYHLFAQISVFPSQTAGVLAHKLSGQGVTILNPLLNCPTQANGIFKDMNSNLGLDSGIVLTNGEAATHGNTIGVNGSSSLLASNNDGAAGDPQLDILAGSSTLDACALEFDVIPLGDTIKFNYVFSSEEYINAVCGPYNDVFAFFISGPGITGNQNMALIPGTNIPVTINSINNGVPGSLGHLSNCTNMGPGSPFTTYYIDNSAGQTLTHHGLTTVLQAIHSVIHCDTYHLKLVIADAGDPLYDSGVFLEAGSLQATNFSVSTMAPIMLDTSYAFCIKGCLPGTFVIKRTQNSGTQQIVRIMTAGDAIRGYDYQSFPDSVIIPANLTDTTLTVFGLPTPLNGNRTLKLYLLSPFDCSGLTNIIDSAIMTIYDTVHLQMLGHDTSICNNQFVALSVEGSDFLSYYWTPVNGLSNPSVKSPFAKPSVATQYVVSGYLSGTNCPTKTASVNIAIKTTPILEYQTDTIVCFLNRVQLNATTATSNNYYSYLWQGPSGFMSTVQSPITDKLDSLNVGVYTLTVTIDTNGCSATINKNVNVYIPARPTFPMPEIFCSGDNIHSLNIVGADIRWYQNMGDTDTIMSPNIFTETVANYQYFITQYVNRCESPKAEFDVEIKKCCDGVIFIPTAFSPNGDGRNDRFEIQEHYGYSIRKLSIFNRWGQVVYTGSIGIWDGTFNGNYAEVGTYFYEIELDCIKGGTIKKTGDIMLVR